MVRILLTIAYDGTDYRGWQRQANGITVQQRLEEALSRIFGGPVAVAGASRTDSGVHARGQRGAFSVEKCGIPIDKLCLVINSHLPGDIAVQAAEYAEPDFNPRFAAREKTYVYRIHNSPYPNPLISRYSWHVPYPLDFAAMAEAAGHFAGTHDFAGFRAAGGSAKTSVRHIYFCGAEKRDSMIELSIRGNGFLYNMVRIIAGTLVYAGAGKIPPESIPGIILSRDRTKAGKTAPAHGLCLERICF